MLRVVAISIVCSGEGCGHSDRHLYRRKNWQEGLTPRIARVESSTSWLAGRVHARMSWREDGVMQAASCELADLLKRWSDGDSAAFQELVPIVYEGLRQVARGRRRQERSDHSLDTTALVHETYLKLAGLRHARLRDRAHFLAMASHVMRRLLVDHARARNAGKRGGDLPHAEFGDDIGVTDENASRIG